MRRRLSPAPSAFTLLEVMVSIAVLALGMTVLLQIQARSILMAQQASAMTVATMLARSKLYDCETDMLKKGFSIGDYKEEGKFDEEGYDDFFWSCHGYKPDLPVPDATDIAQGGAAAQGAGGLGDLAGAGASGDPMAGIGLGMIAPMLGQISQVVGESIRELVVIVRWREGEVWEELQVATHLVDPSGVNAIAAAVSASTGQTGGGGGRGNPPSSSRLQGRPGNPMGINTPRGTGRRP